MLPVKVAVTELFPSPSPHPLIFEKKMYAKLVLEYTVKVSLLLPVSIPTKKFKQNKTIKHANC